jgi:hypothetical protein
VTTRLKTLLTRSGRGIRASAPSLLFLGDDQAAFEAIAPLLDRLARGEQRVDCFLSAADTTLRCWLEARFPGFITVPPPFGFDSVRAAYLRRLKVRTVILLEREAVLNPAYASNLKKRAIPLVLLSGRGVAYLKPVARSGYAPELLVAVDRTADKADQGDTRLRLFQSDTGQMDPSSAAEVLDLLIPLAGRNVKWTNRSDRQIRRWFGQKLFRALDSPSLSTRLRPYVQRFNTLEALAARLGNPRTILCLGNGPSSEDPRLNDVAYDALFRVNHSWMERGLFTGADVVFTGVQTTMRAVKTAIFGLQDEIGEKALLMNRGPGMFKFPFQYFVMSRLGSYLTDFDWGPHRPTNGSAMIAATVALKPKRLVIAGIDLFQHPEGSYPGDKSTANAYTPAHTLDKELAFMFFHLDQFEGEIAIIGEALDHAWREHIRGRDG